MQQQQLNRQRFERNAAVEGEMQQQAQILEDGNANRLEHYDNGEVRWPKGEVDYFLLAL